MATQTKKAAKKPSRRPKFEDWAKLFQKFHVWEILAFIIPFLLIGIGFWKGQMHPFGDNQFLVTDLWHQYYPFFQLLQEKLQHGGSLLYTWRSGMGTNFLAMMSYYAASPLNFVLGKPALYGLFMLPRYLFFLFCLVFPNAYQLSTSNPFSVIRKVCSH